MKGNEVKYPYKYLQRENARIVAAQLKQNDFFEKVVEMANHDFLGEKIRVGNPPINKKYVRLAVKEYLKRQLD